ncbi:MAG: DNA polymerase III subunit alpha [Candidatus Riflebacteria bacterium]|nr:DNA polymerase III subunit alpha [Candidatus Riflebacteria bacterium]
MPEISPISFSSSFSFGYGAVSPAHMAETLKNAGISILPLTDEMTFAGLHEALKAARTNDLHLLAGIRCSLSPAANLLFYPDDRSGFSSLNRSVSLFHRLKIEKCSVLPEISRWLRLNGRGRIIISGPVALDATEQLLSTGWQCFLAIQPGFSLQAQSQIIDFAGRLSISPIIAPDLLLAGKADVNLIRLVRSIRTGSLLSDIPLLVAQSPGDLSRCLELAKRFPNAARANLQFARQPTWIPEEGPLHMPEFFPTRAESCTMLRSLALSGLKRRYNSITPEIQSRFENELQVIANLGFADYFLVVNDITSKARELGHRVLGRGSAANSLISYVLDFTQVDPIKHQLYFERFLNSARKSPPDIDLDFSWRIRDQIYEHLLQRWGEEKVAMISTHISLRGRAALRETGKALGIKKADLDAATSLVGHSSLAEFLSDPARQSRYNLPAERLETLKPLFGLASQIEGLPVHFSIHAGGIVIAPGSIYDFTPTMPSSKVLPITQLEMHGIEKFGLVKLDLLSQRSLGVYSDLVKHREISPATINDSDENKPYQPPSDPEVIEKDPLVANALAKGLTMGVFYIESPGMRGLLEKLACNNYKGLIAASSIIRPGVAESGMMQEYIRRHHHPDGWKPLHPAMGSLLADTHGVMVYQEDVMKVAHHIAGFTLAEADMLRRAMSGKERDPNRMQETRTRFIEGAAAHGTDIKTAGEIWRQISSFCGYAFCKAHSASYAVLSLELLWLKLHFPGQFMAAVINNGGGFYGTQAYISESLRLGLQIRPPDINQSSMEFTCSDNTLLTGLKFITGLQLKTIDKILSQRLVRKFSSVADFAGRIQPAADELDALINSGAMSCFGSQASIRWHIKLSPGNSLFCEENPSLPPLAAQADTRERLILSEMRSLGFSVSGHPLEIFRRPEGVCNAEKLRQMAERRVKVFGLLIAAKSVTTSRGERMKFLTLEDQTGLIEVVMFPAAWNRNQLPFSHSSVLEITGRVKLDQGAITVHGETIKLHESTI